MHLQRLMGMEYLLAHRGARGQSFEYELLYAGEGDVLERFVMGLWSMSSLDDNATAESSTTVKKSSTQQPSKFVGASSPHRGGVVGGSSPATNAPQPRVNGASQAWMDKTTQHGASGPIKNEPVVVSAQS